MQDDHHSDGNTRIPSTFDNRVSLQSILDGIPDSLMVIDTDYRVRMVNNAALDLYLNGKSPRTGLFCHEITHLNSSPCNGDDHPCPMRMILEKQRPVTVTHTHCTSSGFRLPVEIHASPLRDKNGKIIGIVKVCRDITERLIFEKQRSENEIRRFRYRQEQALGVLAGGIAHDFNNLLMAVMGNAELMSLRLSNHPECRHMAEEIISASRRMANLTAQLLAYGKGGKYLPSSLDVPEIIREALTESREEFPAVSIRTDLRLPDGLWHVQGDRNQIAQVFQNVFNNAFEALVDRPGGMLTIQAGNITRKRGWECMHADTHQPGDYLEIRVSDTGAGISQKNLPRIFEPFYSTKFTGRGLGLAAALGIIRNHGGCLTATSNGAGAEFVILLPRHPPDQSGKAEKLTPPPPEAGLSSDQKILIVEDDPRIRKIMTAILVNRGYEVITAADGEQALAVLRKEAGDINPVILDIQLPDMDGCDLFRRIKQQKSDARILIASGHDRRSILERRDLGDSDAIIEKPFLSTELLECIFRMRV